MNSDKVSKFLRKLEEKTENQNIIWEELDIEEIAQILSKLSSYTNIIGAYGTLNSKQRKYSIIGKYKMKVYYEEDIPSIIEYVFFAIADNDFNHSIVFTEDDLDYLDCERISKMYRYIETSEVPDILDSWFEED
ncbi:hypothetical protein [Lysinibacillus sp. K60]|uniref:hypothetical protein n=1 Tax=Lysinibacillus sp. K60 TaxID=2720027 RepID=UPI001C8CB73F|nr:hypothetical protein [Lysinibacillus sp. K60]MBX8944004.1 hypothetical protein [Lysinibacillus sp. K60]